MAQSDSTSMGRCLQAWRPVKVHFKDEESSDSQVSPSPIQQWRVFKVMVQTNSPGSETSLLFDGLVKPPFHGKTSLYLVPNQSVLPRFTGQSKSSTAVKNLPTHEPFKVHFCGEEYSRSWSRQIPFALRRGSFFHGPARPHTRGKESLGLVQRPLPWWRASWLPT